MDLAKLHLHWRSMGYRGKTYTSYSLARHVKRNGGNRKEIVVKLGKLSDEGVTLWRQILRLAKNPRLVVADPSELGRPLRGTSGERLREGRDAWKRKCSEARSSLAKKAQAYQRLVEACAQLDRKLQRIQRENKRLQALVKTLSKR